MKKFSKTQFSAFLINYGLANLTHKILDQIDRVHLNNKIINKVFIKSFLKGNNFAQNLHVIFIVFMQVLC